MRITQILHRQHIGWHFKKLWAVQAARKVQETQALEVLKKHNIPIVDSSEFRNEIRQIFKLDIVGYEPKPQPLDETHPNWHHRRLLTYRDNNVLVEGLAQAKALTNTVEIINGLPESLELQSVKGYNSRAREIIISSHLFDAEQQKLPKVKDPLRPAWNFPRTYGITQARATKLLLGNLLQLIESISPPEAVEQRYLANDLLFSYNFEKFNELIQFELTSETLLISTKPLPPVTNQATNELQTPDLSPVIPTVSLSRENIYETSQIYPIDLNVRKPHPHTVFIHHDETKVANLYEEPVTTDQIFARSLLKTFTVAASYARKKHGNEIGNLPEPVVLQCVHTNGRLFHFGILQLNTLDLNNQVKNIWYQTEQIPLFENCFYKLGRPVLEGYKSDVLRHLKTFYLN